jgi:hypothetical protein
MFSLGANWERCKKHLLPEPMKKSIVIALTVALSACSRPTPSVNQSAGGSNPLQATPLVASVPLTIPTPTAQWIDAGNNGVASVQFQPVKSDGVKAQFWVRVVFNQPQPTGDQIQAMLQDADCQRGIYYSRYLVRFDSNQRLLSEGTPADANQAVVVQPDSPAETAFKLSCANPK